MSGYLITIMAAYILVVMLGYWLDFLNLSHLKKHGAVIPPEFEGHIDQELLSKTRDYNVENTNFGFIASVFNNVIFLVFLFVLLNIYNSWVVSLKLSFIFSGLIFFLLITYGETIRSMPVSLYSTP
jgi:STE24 endopeptidase